MHTSSHDPHITEIQQAYANLLYERKARSQAEVARKLGISAAHFGDLLLGKKRVTQEIKKKFEIAYGVKLAKLAKPIEIKMESGDPVNFKHYVCGRLTLLEIQNNILFDYLAELLGKTPAEMKRIRREIAAKVDLKVKSVQALIIDE